MSVNFSPLLTKVIERAKKIADYGRHLLTAERLIVSAIEIDHMIVTDEYSKEEIDDTKRVVARVFGNLITAKDSLCNYIYSDKLSEINDDLFMKKKLMAAQSDAALYKRDEITVPQLLEIVLREPSEAISNAIAASKNVAGSNAGEDAGNAKSGTNKQEKRSKQRISDGAGSAGSGQNRMDDKLDMTSLVKETKRIRSHLQQKIFGQDNAINVFVSGYFRSRLFSSVDASQNRPRATFLFAGPPGVGKTFLAESAAEIMRLPFRRFDMSEYADKEANLEFCGSDKVYKNGKEGNVTSFVAENPRCVLLFDEIEKAHIVVIHLFLQMLDAGRLRDNYTDEEVSFTDAIIIMTTNAGKQLYNDSETGDFSTLSRKIILKALQDDKKPETGDPYFPGAICSRFASGNIVMFNHIGVNNLRSIAKNEILRQASNLSRRVGMDFSIDEKVYTALLFSEGGNADARMIRSRAEAFFSNELYELMRLIESDKVTIGIDDVKKIRIETDLSDTCDEIKYLFNDAERAKVLVFADKDTVDTCSEKASSIEFIGVSDYEDAVNIVKTQDIDLVMLDMTCGAAESGYSNLNIEDVLSPVRDFFKFLREYRSALPVYILEKSENSINEEERVSFAGQGVREVLRLYEDGQKFESRICEIASVLYQQESMAKLAKSNKVISFETAQSVSDDGKSATIRLFDFKMIVAVDSEDAKDVLSAVSTPNVSFDDVIGAAEVKTELAYFIEYLKNPRKYMGTGVKPPKGIILHGPPGTGKTMLAKAMAFESGVTFIAAEGNQFAKRYVGEGPEAVHRLFRTARKYAPSILFIDEIDAIAKNRMDEANSNDAALTAFLTEMDGFSSDASKPVFVLAATNFAIDDEKGGALDPALMRRFDRRVYIGLPGKEDRIRFMKMKAEKNPAIQISDAEIENIAVRSTGMSLAALDSAMELALRSAIRAGSTVVTDSIFDEAFETFNNGEVKKWDDEQLKRVARHEAGHALISCLSGDIPTYLTIISRGNFGGYMFTADSENKAIYTRDELLKRIRIALGGRAGEIVYYGDSDGITTGASGDLAAATTTAQNMICSYGMDKDFGLAAIGSAVAAGGSVTEEVIEAVNRMLREQMDEAVRLISENKDKMDALVGALMKKNYMTSEEIGKIFNGDAE